MIGGNLEIGSYSYRCRVVLCGLPAVAVILKGNCKIRL